MQGQKRGLHKQWLKAQLRNERTHLLVSGFWWILLEATGCVEYLGKQTNVSYSVQEYVGLFKNPVYSSVDVLLLFQWFIPDSVGMLATQPGFIGDWLDGLHCNVVLLACSE